MEGAVETCDQLRHQVCEANLALVQHGLVVLTWGNVSAIDRGAALVAIKPSGVPYAGLTPADIVLVNLAGDVLEGTRRPSSDLATHLALYRAFPSIGGVAHTHSPCATAFAQACRPLPCFGTTHADQFRGTVPVTRRLAPAELTHDYEANTGGVIVDAFRDLDPDAVPAVLVASHGPFTWGRDAGAAVCTSAVLEAAAAMALRTLYLAPHTPSIDDALQRCHFERKHGPHATYGQDAPSAAGAAEIRDTTVTPAPPGSSS